MTDTVVIYVHGKGGTPEEVNHYIPLFPNHDVIGLDYKSETPKQAKEEFPKLFTQYKKQYNSIVLIGNSIGAYFSMIAGISALIDRAYFISPMVDMESMILEMMKWASVSEEELKEKKEIITEFGEVLSWDYLSYVRNYPIFWNVDTKILYGENDNLTSLKTMKEFCSLHSYRLCVMLEGEHWFHTEEQMEFLDRWIYFWENISNIHTTEMGIERIQRNLNIQEDVVAYCKEKILDISSTIYRKGKNWYVENQEEIFTINAKSLTIITAHRRKSV